jgi:hypothetical protein
VDASKGERACHVPGELFYVPDDTAALVTPDALATMLRQGGMRCEVERNDNGDVDIVLSDDKTVLLLAVEEGFVSSIVVDVTFVDAAAKSPRVCELLESLGWVEAEDE